MTLILSGSNGLSDVDGTAATPAIRGTDADTGIFFPAANVVAVAVGGVEVNRFTSSGLNGISGIQGQVFNNTGTFTIPAGVTTLKVTVVGGGGSGTAVVVCNVAGNSGGTSSVSSGTQTISTISATGGSGASATGTALVSGGAGSGGDLNMDGGVAGQQTSTRPYAVFGASFLSQPTTGAGNLGAGGSGLVAVGQPIRYGAGGGTAIKYLTGLTPGNTLTVTVGNGGASSGSGSSAGGKGVVIFEW